MQWWIRPGYSRCCAIRKPAPCAPSSAPAGNPDVLVAGSRRGCRTGRTSRPTGAPSSRRRGRCCTPGVSASTTNIDARWCGRASGSVTAITIRKSAIEPFEENHLWPLITHSSPSLTAARLQQRRIRAGGVGLGHAEGGLQIAGEQRVQVAVLLLRRAGEREDLGVARIGRRVAERERRDRRRAEDLVHQPELDLAESLTAELGIEMRRPQAARLDLLLERLDRIASGPPSRARRAASRAARSARARTRAIQSSCCWNSGSVEKSQAIAWSLPSSTGLRRVHWVRLERTMAQQHLDRLTSIDASFLHQEGPASHMHIGGVLLFEGPPPDVRPSTSITSAAGCTSSRATARSWRRRRSRPAGRCGSTTRASTSSTTSATPRSRRRAPRSSCSSSRPGSPRSSSTARSRCGRAGCRRVLDEADRFALIFKTHHSLVDGVSGVDLATVLLDLEQRARAAGRRRHRARAVAARSPSRPARSWSSPGPAGSSITTAEIDRARARRRGAAGHVARDAARRRRGDRRDRLGGAQPGAGDAAQRRDRSAPPVPRRAPGAARLQARQGRARRNGQRRRADGRVRRARATGSTLAGFAPRASRCERSCRCRSGPGTSATRSATS